MTRQEKIEAIRKEFPKHNKAAYSMAVRTDETGVMLCPRAKALCGGKRDSHKKQYSLRVRVTEARYRQVKQLIEQEGLFPTINAWLDWWVYVWIQTKERAASTDGAEEAAEQYYDITERGGCQ